jgi:hypothetical protein
MTAYRGLRGTENGLMKKWMNQLLSVILSITKRFQIIGAAEALSLVESDREVYRHRLQTLRTCGLKA